MPRRSDESHLARNSAESLEKQSRLIEHAWRLQQMGEVEVARDVYESVLKLNPKNFNAIYMLGNIAAEAGMYQLAVDWYGKAIRIDSRYAEPYNNQGNALLSLDKPGAALACFDKAIVLTPDYAEAHSNRGSALMGLKRLDEAVASFDKAIGIKPDYAEAYSNRGSALMELKRLDEAVASFDKAIGLKPDYAEAYSHRGNALLGLNRLDDSLSSFETAIRLKPDYAEAHSNHGNVLLQLKLLDAAIDSFDRAIGIKPDYSLPHTNKSMALLLDGKFSDGWELYEWRRKSDVADSKRHFRRPLWLGAESITGKTVLLHSEQGLGDTIQFCRYARLVHDLGARVILEVPQSLMTLLRGLEGVDVLIESDQRVLPAFDYHCPLLSLPLAFRTELSTIPHPQPYLKAEKHKVLEWGKKLGQQTKARVGLVWSGSVAHRNDHNRSVSLEALLPYLSPNVEYVCLQKELRDSDRIALENSPVRYFGEEISDFSDTAALCELVDMVVSVDSSVAHLAGALGKSTRVLLPYVPDWRWLLDRDDSPWYQSVHLCRQDKSRDWSSAIRHAMADPIM